MCCEIKWNSAKQRRKSQNKCWKYHTQFSRSVKLSKATIYKTTAKSWAMGSALDKKKPLKRCALTKYKLDIGAQWDTCLSALLHVGCQEIHVAGLLFTLWPHRAYSSACWMNQPFSTAGVSEFNGFLDPEVMQLFFREVIYIEPVNKWSKQWMTHWSIQNPHAVHKGSWHDCKVMVWCTVTSSKHCVQLIQTVLCSIWQIQTNWLTFHAGHCYTPYS